MGAIRNAEKKCMSNARRRKSVSRLKNTRATHVVDKHRAQQCVEGKQ